jgi:hypothetical protein
MVEMVLDAIAGGHPDAVVLPDHARRPRAPETARTDGSSSHAEPAPPARLVG